MTQPPNVAVVLPVFDGKPTQTLLAALPRDAYRRVVVVGADNLAGVESLPPAGSWASGCLAARRHLESTGERPDVVAILDSRCEPNQLTRVTGPVVRGEGVIAMGSRRMRRQPAGAISTPRLALNWLACRAIQFTTGKVYTDVSPFRAMTWDVFTQLAGAGPIAMQFKAPRMKLKVIEIPVDYAR